MRPIIGKSQDFTPQYARIRDDITENIRSGKLKPGDQIPSLTEICQLYHVSMATSRRVTTELIQDGLATRRDGIGLFVSSTRRRARIALALIGYSEQGWRNNSDMFGQLVGGVAGASWERDAILSVIPIGEAKVAASTLGSLLNDQPFDGVLLRTAGDVDPELVDLLIARKTPFSSIKRSLPADVAPFVIGADQDGSLQATEYLLSLGHTRIGLILSSASTQIAVDIQHGYELAHGRQPVAVDPALIRHVPQALEAVGHEAALQLFALPEPPTAIFAASDLLALGVYSAAQQVGLRIPTELSVVGFDDQDFAPRLSPPLTTLHLSYYDLGHAAAHLLFGIIDGQPNLQSIMLKTALVVRGSVTPLRMAVPPAGTELSRDHQ